MSHAQRIFVIVPRLNILIPARSLSLGSHVDTGLGGPFRVVAWCCTVQCTVYSVHWQIFSYTKIVSRKSRKEKQGFQYMLLNERKLTELCLRHFVLRHRAIRKD